MKDLFRKGRRSAMLSFAEKSGRIGLSRVRLRRRATTAPTASAADILIRALGRHAEQTGMVVAAAVAPGTFARSLGGRSALDQGIVTGIVTGLTYATTVATQDALAAVARVGSRAEADDVRRRMVLVNLVAISAGLAVPRVLPVRDDESPLRSLARQAAWRSGLTGLGSLLFLGSGWAADRVDSGSACRGRLDRLPLGVPAGLLLAAGLEWRRRRSLPATSTDREEAPALPASLGISLGVTAGLIVLALGEERLASAIDHALARRVPGSTGMWRVAGHAAVLAGLATAGSAVWTRAMRRVESAVLTVDPVLAHEAENHWTLDTCSGSPPSLVSWESLGREGRRHVATAVRPNPLATRPPGFPDLSIPTVTGRHALATPVEVYIGLDAAPTPAERVDLALAEMDRTGAWERQLIMLVSPTGTGYVNYAAVAATQYLSRGDVATVTLQYSKRPSPLSLGKIAGAREQNRLLWSKIAARVRDMPLERRPRVVLFGESLGAHTSQAVFLHWGTVGLQALGIDRALWVGTPYSSGWMREVTRAARADTDTNALAVVNDIEQFHALPPQQRERVRYVLLSHDNDGVTKFGTDLIMRSPRWLREPPTGVEEVEPYSPRGVPASMRWRPVTTFFQLLIDMKNAQIPGSYQATRHDYRPDLTRFINEVYGLGATEEELRTVEAAVARREQARVQILSSAPTAS